MPCSIGNFHEEKILAAPAGALVEFLNESAKPTNLAPPLLKTDPGKTRQ